jgi:hypothetical protein
MARYNAIYVPYVPLKFAGQLQTYEVITKLKKKKDEGPIMIPGIVFLR